MDMIKLKEKKLLMFGENKMLAVCFKEKAREAKKFEIVGNFLQDVIKDGDMGAIFEGGYKGVNIFEDRGKAGRGRMGYYSWLSSHC